MGRLADVANTLTLYKVVMTAGVVVKVKDEPPFEVVNDVAGTVDDTAKSDAIPVVAPLVPETLIVQTTSNPVREGLVLVQTRLEAVVG
jgi:hypothetical protein